jgi:hypothetical protein
MKPRSRTAGVTSIGGSESTAAPGATAGAAGAGGGVCGDPATSEAAMNATEQPIPATMKRWRGMNLRV